MITIPEYIEMFKNLELIRKQEKRMYKILQIYVDLFFSDLDMGDKFILKNVYNNVAWLFDNEDYKMKCEKCGKILEDNEGICLECLGQFMFDTMSDQDIDDMSKAIFGNNWLEEAIRESKLKESKLENKQLISKN